MDKLIINDRFKAWMRDRLSDRSYAERLFHALIDETDATLLDVWPHAALPRKSALDDPEAMIGMLTGYDSTKGVDIVVAIFGKWEDFEELSQQYFSVIWGMQNPIKYSDFESLPNVYEIAFADLGEEAEAMQKRRWTVTIRNLTDGNDGITETKPYDETKLNIVNTSIESDLVRLICGEEM